MHTVTPIFQQSLIPFDVTTKEDETQSMMMYNLLLGPCKRLAQDRVHAIRDGRSIPSMMESLADESVDKESVKSKIDAELEKAKESGLNFNVLCNIWLFDVGVLQTDKGKSTDVSRFLNRLLGMNMNRQKLMFQYFLKSLENQVNNAKRAGTYDVGIRTLRGNNVEFHEKPRTFTFGGVTAKDDKVYLYKVAQDQGTTFETAMELYNDAKNENVPTSTSNSNGWQRRGHRIEIKTGFYTDSRSLFRVTPKVFLIINPGAHSESCVSIRPNIGRRTWEKVKLREQLMQGNLSFTSVEDAMETWNREFELADISADENYQFSCAGRVSIQGAFFVVSCSS